MNCEEVQSNLLDYIDCQIDSDMMHEISAHLESCEHCKMQYGNWQDTLEEIQKTKQMLYSIPNRISVKDNIMQHISIYEHNKRTYKRNMHIWNRLAGMAAALAIMFSGYAVYGDYQASISEPPVIDQAFSEISMKKEDVVRISSNDETMTVSNGQESVNSVISYSLGGVFAGMAFVSIGMRKRNAKQLNEYLQQ